MSRQYSTAELMDAIVDLRDATAHGFASLRTELRAEMDRRFENVDAQFESLEG